MQSLLVKHFMDANPHAIHYSTPIRKAVESMVSDRIVGAPVVDDSKHVIGFVSEQDCLKEMLNETFYCDDSLPVSSVMNKEVLTVSPDATIFELAEKMAEFTPKYYPVVQQDKLVGLISRSRILAALLKTGEDCYLRH